MLIALLLLNAFALHFFLVDSSPNSVDLLGSESQTTSKGVVVPPDTGKQTEKPLPADKVEPPLAKEEKPQGESLRA